MADTMPLIVGSDSHDTGWGVTSLKESSRRTPAATSGQCPGAHVLGQREGSAVGSA